MLGRETEETQRINLHIPISKEKCAQINFLPNFPQGEDPSSLDCLRQAIVEEVKKTERPLLAW